jgi:hypothetical protein
MGGWGGLVITSRWLEERQPWARMLQDGVLPGTLLVHVTGYSNRKRIKNTHLILADWEKRSREGGHTKSKNTPDG